MRFFFFIILLSCNVFALAVTPSQLDFSSYGKAKLVVFNTEDYVTDFSLDVYGSGFSVDKSSLRIPPRSSMPINVFSSCSDCESKLYVRELSTSTGIKVEPVIIVKLSSGTPAYDDSESVDEPNDVTSSSFFDVKKPEVLAFIAILSLLLISGLFFLGRRIYIKKFYKKSKSRKRK